MFQLVSEARENQAHLSSVPDAEFGVTYSYIMSPPSVLYV